jgi:3-oxoacyl-[acyl-carrier-protein] synthase-1
LPATFDYGVTQDMFSLAGFVRAALALRGPAMVVSTACASSARTFIDARQLMECGVCDAVIVGGADSLCSMTLRGFASLDLISPDACRPCDAERGGISIGEAAGFALLERDGAGTALLGCGTSSDGYHMSAPHPQGAGAIAAMRAALEVGGLSAADIDYVNLHGTGTRQNDAMEDTAMAEVFGAATPCSSTKGWTGHTLGASGILEAVIAGLCIDHGFMPGCLNVTRRDPAFRARVIMDNEQRPIRRVMSNAFGFGGINCSLIFGTVP